MPDRFDGVRWSHGLHGAPIIDDALALLECKAETTYEVGDHIIIVGRVESFARSGGEPLLFAQGRFAIAADHPDFKARAPAKSDSLPERHDGLMSISMLLLLAHYVSSAALEVHRPAEGLTHAQTRVLYGLSSTRSVSFKQLLDRTYVSASAAEDAVEELIERSCIVREIDDHLKLSELGLQRRN